jgi:sugar phosphate isomerase/epimerase
VHFGREWSLFGLRERCEHAARVGFAGIGLWHADLEHMLETRTLRELRQIVDDHGLRRLELEFLGDWFLDPDDERRRASDERRRLLFEAAAELPAHHIKVGNIVGTECELPRIVEAFGELCEDAARHTDAKIVYEFMPYDVNVGDVDKALAVVEGADAPNGGLALDTWHLGKLRLEPEDLRRIPPRFLSWVELCDGPYEYAEDRLDEVINRRKLPGEGEFPVAGYVAVCRELGYDGPWGVEVLSEELRRLPIDEMFDRAYETTTAQLALARERSPRG